MAHGEIYWAELGWDTSFEGLVAKIVADYAADHDPQREAAWIAERAGRRVGCIPASRTPTITQQRSCGSCSSTPTAEDTALSMGPRIRTEDAARALITVRSEG
ncbi:MAG: hypothetical protein ACR2IP_06995 [Solirubrobacteraceae bacterium]